MGLLDFLFFPFLNNECIVYLQRKQYIKIEIVVFHSVASNGYISMRVYVMSNASFAAICYSVQKYYCCSIIEVVKKTSIRRKTCNIVTYKRSNIIKLMKIINSMILKRSMLAYSGLEMFKSAK